MKLNKNQFVNGVDFKTMQAKDKTAVFWMFQSINAHKLQLENVFPNHETSISSWIFEFCLFKIIKGFLVTERIKSSQVI